MTLSDDDDLVVTIVGEVVRAGRRKLGLSVHQFAELAGLSLGLISTLERGQGNPSLQTLRRVAEVLGVPLAELLTPQREEVTVIRQDERTNLAIPEGPPSQRVVRELLTPRGDRRLQMIRSTLPPGFTNEENPFRHLATEVITVLSGSLLLVHGNRKERLEAGDSATYLCETPHWWANLVDSPTVVLGAITTGDR